MIFKSPRGQSGNSWQENSQFYLPFSCIFNHNSSGAKYFEAKRVQTV